jgi:tetratricopeptide (TPR) repeat protein
MTLHGGLNWKRGSFIFDGLFIFCCLFTGTVCLSLLLPWPAHVLQYSISTILFFFLVPLLFLSLKSLFASSSQPQRSDRLERDHSQATVPAKNKKNVRYKALTFFICCIILVSATALEDVYTEHHKTAANDAAQMGRFEAVVKHYKDIVRYNPRDDEAWAELAMFYEREQTAEARQKALACYRKAANLSSYENVKAVVGLLSYNDRQNQRDQVCELLGTTRRLAQRIDEELCGYWRVVECVTRKKFVKEYVLRLVLPRLSDKWNC